MNTSNEQITSHLNKIGQRLVELESVVLAFANTQAQQYKLIASSLKGVSPEEDALLRAAAQQCLDSLQKLLPLHAQLQAEVDAFSKL
jgi:hypothetical protein